MDKKILLVASVTLFFCVNSSHASKVACIGDSITYGYNITDQAHNSYPVQLEVLLQEFDSTWETKNFGVSGATLLRNGDLPYVNQTMYNDARSWKPDVVVIMLGTNDSKPYNWIYKDEFVPNYCALIDSFASLSSDPEIWICKPVPAFSTNYNIRNEVIRDEIIPLIDEIAGLREVKVIDLYTPLLDASSMFPDGIHPNAEGAGLMAKVIAPILLGTIRVPDLNQDGYINLIDYAKLTQTCSSEPNAPEPNEPNSCDPNSIYDLAPAPNGDGTINLIDVAVLTKYWLKTPGLIAYWKLDETEGTSATESISGKLSELHGNALWQPLIGHNKGALELNGSDSYIKTEEILDPVNGPFTIFIWTKGGQPGQTLVFQESGKQWIGIDSATGGVCTQLTDGGRSTKALISDIPFTTDYWHLVSLVWDGSYRHLYVDNVEVAADSKQLNPLLSSEGGLYFGAAENMNQESFWSGLIDDIRIYDKALLP